MSGHHLKHACAAAALLAAFGAVPAEAAGPKIVSGPSADAGCFVPWTDKTKFFQYAKKPGPYRVALANGFIGNTWRIQMIKTAKAYAEQPAVKKQLKEFKVVSTGDDIAAQISAVNNFIDSGYDAVIIDAQNPTAFRSAVKRAEAAGVVLVAFDNTLDTDEAINVNVDQQGLGQYWGEWLAKSLPRVGTCWKCAACPARPSTPTATRACRTPSRRRASRSAPSRSWASGTTARPRKCRPTPSRCTSISTA